MVSNKRCGKCRIYSSVMHNFKNLSRTKAGGISGSVSQSFLLVLIGYTQSGRSVTQSMARASALLSQGYSYRQQKGSS